MDIDKKLLAVGVLLLITGIITAVLSYNPSRVLQYVFIAGSLGVGVFALLIARQAKKSFVRSQYYTWIGITSIAMAMSVGIWATTLGAFIDVIGFFLLVLGIIEFVFVLQILSYETPTRWKVLALKLGIAGIAAIGAAWILTMAEIDVNPALLFSGALLVLVGLGFIQLSRMRKVA